MKTENCIIQLTFVPECISCDTDGGIQSDMYLQRDAVSDLIKGKMFSPLDCMWGSADMVSGEDAMQALRQLTILGMCAKIVDIN